MKQLQKILLALFVWGSDGNRKFFCAIIRGHDGI